MRQTLLRKVVGTLLAIGMIGGAAADVVIPPSSCGAYLAAGTFDTFSSSSNEEAAGKLYDMASAHRQQRSANASSGGGSVGLDVIDYFDFSGSQSNSSSGSSSMSEDAARMTRAEFVKKWGQRQESRTASETVGHYFNECMKEPGLQIVRLIDRSPDILVIKTTYTSPITLPNSAKNVVHLNLSRSGMKCDKPQQRDLVPNATDVIKCIRTGNGPAVLTVSSTNYNLGNRDVVFVLPDPPAPVIATGSVTGILQAVTGTIRITTSFQDSILYSDHSASGGFGYKNSLGEDQSYGAAIRCWQYTQVRGKNILVVAGPEKSPSNVPPPLLPRWLSLELTIGADGSVTNLRTGGGYTRASVCIDEPDGTGPAKSTDASGLKVVVGSR